MVIVPDGPISLQARADRRRSRAARREAFRLAVECRTLAEAVLHGDIDAAWTLHWRACQLMGVVNNARLDNRQSA